MEPTGITSISDSQELPGIMAIPTNVVAAAARKGRAKATNKAAGEAKVNGEAPAGEAIAPADVTPKAQARPAGAAKAETAAKPGADRRAAIRSAAGLLKQVSDATRLEVLVMLADGPRNVGDMATELGVSQPALSHHLALCRHGRLVEPIRQGKENHYHLTDSGRRLVEAVRSLVGGGADGEG